MRPVFYRPIYAEPHALALGFTGILRRQYSIPPPLEPGIALLVSLVYCGQQISQSLNYELALCNAHNPASCWELNPCLLDPAGPGLNCAADVEWSRTLTERRENGVKHRETIRSGSCTAITVSSVVF